MCRPRMSGVEVCQRLKEDPETLAIPVMLVTASRLKNLEERCRIFGAAACVVKPYDWSELIDKLRRLLAAQPAVTSPSLTTAVAPSG